MTNPHAQKIRAFLKEQEELEKARGKVLPWEACIRRHTMGNLGITTEKWHASGPDLPEKEAKSDSEYVVHLVNNAAKMRKLVEEYIEDLEFRAKDRHDYLGANRARDDLEQAAKILDSE